ncbi:MAG: DUF4011 domain-containing protein, partial [Actinobacteria bacterium]
MSCRRGSPSRARRDGWLSTGPNKVAPKRRCSKILSTTTVKTSWSRRGRARCPRYRRSSGAIPRGSASRTAGRARREFAPTHGSEPHLVSSSIDDTRRSAVDTAVTTWMSQLVDLGASNRLLYYRTLTAGTLDLDRATVSAIEALRQGGRVMLSALFPDLDQRADASRRMRAINAKAIENLEERGLRTLYLAWGMASWTPVGTAATPAAPVLLFPLRATRKGTAGEEFELTVAGEVELNPTLIQLLHSRHGITIAADDIVDHATPDDSIEPDALLVFNEMMH